MSFKRKMIHCATQIKKDAVKRESIGGVEHIVVSSCTLPDDIVMNGGMYPASEIESSYKSLERTLAPVEHPTDLDGNFISASDPYAIHNFHAGAFNTNVTRKDGRVHIEKRINVQEALKTERGKRLLDRINELETNENPRPIHTSVGVWLEVEPLGEMKTNAAGLQYDWIARNMVFDHDAILLDNIGAAQPSQGVGMAVNAEGEQVVVESVMMPEEPETAAKEDIGQRTLNEQLQAEISDIIGAEYTYLVDVFDDYVIFESKEKYFTVPYRLDNGIARIVGIPIRVDKVVTYTPKVNHETQSKGDAMKELLVNALIAANIETKDLTDEQLLAKYNELQANQAKSDDSGANDGSQLAEIVANALKPVTDELASLKSQLNANANDERAKYAEIVANSGKYQGIDVETAKTFTIEKLKELASNCGYSHGLPITANAGGVKSNVPTDMPE